MAASVSRRWIERVSKIGGVVPLVWFAGVWILYFRARNYLGHWPRPSLDDPKLLPFEFHHGILAMAIFPLVATLVAMPLVWLVQRQVSGRTFRSHMTSSRWGGFSSLAHS